MKVFRFMSEEEFLKLLQGHTLKNKIDYKRLGRRTGTVGFGFLDKSKYAPEYAWHFLKGIDEYDYCVEFEVSNDIKFGKSKGIYRKPVEMSQNIHMSLLDFIDYVQNYNETIEVDELSITEYNSTKFEIIRFCKTPLWSDEKDWFWKNFKEVE